MVPLALLVLAGCGISSTAGKQVGTAFLIRTPDLIEDGMRNMLSELLPEAAITKRRLILGESGLSMNPDLVFGAGSAVGDVKYRYLSGTGIAQTLIRASPSPPHFGVRDA